MLRDDWKFPYPAGKLAQAAKDKVAFYESRVKYWESKKEKVVKKIREEGLDISESVAADDKSYFSNSVQRRPAIQIDTSLQTDLDECHQKLARHRSNVAVYDGWHATLSDRPADEILQLEQDDWLFFFSQKT